MKSMERCEGMQQSVRGGQKKILIMLWGCRTNVRQLILYSTQNAGLRKARRLWYN